MQRAPRRIAVGGFQHETNTFASARSGYGDFLTAGGWPGLTRGSDMPISLSGANIPVSGALQRLAGLGCEIVPLLWAAAPPSSYVTQDAFERIVDELSELLAAALPFDGVYLDLHGAMVPEHIEDGDGEVLRRVRDIVGPSIPVVASVDLHGNLSASMVAKADALVSYRTYPHIDRDKAGARAVDVLLKRLDHGRPFAKAFHQIPFLVPLPFQSTLSEPGVSLVRKVEELEAGDVVSVSWLPGFPSSDIADCAPSVVAYGLTQAAADTAAQTLSTTILDHEAIFAQQPIYTPDEAVRLAIEKTDGAHGPVIILDAQDNPGAGAPSDAMGMVQALLRNGVDDAIVGLVVDAEAVKAAHQAGVGSSLHLTVGGKSDGNPLAAGFRVEALGDGEVLGTGPVWGGSQMSLGAMAVLSVDGVRIVVASRRWQAADQSMFRHVGIEPAEQTIMVLKSAVHFRADFAPIAHDILYAAAPGQALIDPRALPWKNLRRGMRLLPNGPAFMPSGGSGS